MGIAEPVIGRAFARPVGSTHPTARDEQRAAAIIDVASTKRTDGRVLQMPSGIFFTLRRGLIH